MIVDPQALADRARGLEQTLARRGWREGLAGLLACGVFAAFALTAGSWLAALRPLLCIGGVGVALGVLLVAQGRAPLWYLGPLVPGVAYILVFAAWKAGGQAPLAKRFSPVAGPTGSTKGCFGSTGPSQSHTHSTTLPLMSYRPHALGAKLARACTVLRSLLGPASSPVATKRPRRRCLSRHSGRLPRRGPRAPTRPRWADESRLTRGPSAPARPRWCRPAPAPSASLKALQKATASYQLTPCTRQIWPAALGAGLQGHQLRPEGLADLGRADLVAVGDPGGHGLCAQGHGACLHMDQGELMGGGGGTRHGVYRNRGQRCAGSGGRLGGGGLRQRSPGR